jgi:antitoxin MazE
VVSKGQVIITAIDKVEYDLDTLVSGINVKNTHDEVSFGAPVGKEAL